PRNRAKPWRGVISEIGCKNGSTSTCVSDVPCHRYAPSTALQTAGAVRPGRPERRSPNCLLRMRCVGSMPGDRNRRMTELFEAEHHSDTLLDAAMVAPKWPAALGCLTRSTPLGNLTTIRC